MIRRARRDGIERLGEMRKGEKKERIEKGSREGIEKETKHHLKRWRARDRPPFIRISRSDPVMSSYCSSPQGMTSWSSSIKFLFLQAYRKHY